MKVEAVPTLDPQEPSDERAVRSIDAFFDQVHGRLSWRNLLRRHRYWLLIFAVAFSSVSDSLDYGMMRFVVSDDRFQSSMIHHNFRRGAYAFVALSAGAVAGKVVSGLLVDHLSPHIGGRRRAFLFGLTSNLVGTVGTALSPTMASLVLCQFLSGAGASTTYTASSLLLVEMFPPSYRGTYSAASDLFWAIGTVCGSLNAMFVLQTDNEQDHNQDNLPGIYNETLTEGADDHLTGIYNATEFAVDAEVSKRGPAAWRYFSLLTAVPSLIGLILALLLVPESARYLAMAGRYEEAAQVANYIARAMAGTTNSTAGASLSSDAPAPQPQMYYRPLSVHEIRHLYDGPTLGNGANSLLTQNHNANGNHQQGGDNLQNHRDRNQGEQAEQEQASNGSDTTNHTRMANASLRSSSSLVASVISRFLEPFRYGATVRNRTIALLFAHVSLILPGGMGVGFEFTILRKALSSKLLSKDTYALSLLTTLITLGTKAICMFAVDRFSRPSLEIAALAIMATGKFLYAAGVAHDHPFDTDDAAEDDEDSEPSSRNVMADFVIVLGLCLGTIGSAANGTTLYLWTRELIPTAIRGTVVSTTIGGSKEVAYILSNAFSGLLMQAGSPVTMIVLAGVGISMAIVPAWLLPDTRGKALPDGTTTLSQDVPVPPSTDGQKEGEEEKVVPQAGLSNGLSNTTCSNGGSNDPGTMLSNGLSNEKQHAESTASTAGRQPRELELTTLAGNDLDVDSPPLV